MCYHLGPQGTGLPWQPCSSKTGPSLDSPSRVSSTPPPHLTPTPEPTSGQQGEYQSSCFLHMEWHEWNKEPTEPFDEHRGNNNLVDSSSSLEMKWPLASWSNRSKWTMRNLSETDRLLTDRVCVECAQAVPRADRVSPIMT